MSTIFKPYIILPTISFYSYLHPFTKCINNRSTYSMKSTRNLISTFSKLTTGMQNSIYNLRSRYTTLMHSNRNTSTLITNTNRTITMNNYFNIIAITIYNLIHAIINYFPHKMMQTPLIC